MANEKRLIDANELVQALYKSDAELHSCDWMTSEIVDQIDRMPTVDAVEVVYGEWLYDSGSERYLIASGVTIPVRCKDCKHMEKTTYGLRWCNVWEAINGMGDDGFCNYGERRTDD